MAPIASERSGPLPTGALRRGEITTAAAGHAVRQAVSAVSSCGGAACRRSHPLMRPGGAFVFLSHPLTRLDHVSCPATRLDHVSCPARYVAGPCFLSRPLRGRDHKHSAGVLARQLRRGALVGEHHRISLLFHVDHRAGIDPGGVKLV